MADGAGTFGIQPSVWLLVFERRAVRRWVKWLACGEFCHVSALGRLSDQRVWVRYDVSLGGTTISVLPDSDWADAVVSAVTETATVVVMQPGEPVGARLRVGFWCVPAMAHLVGLRGVFLRPDALFRACIKAGGAVI
jgi:hypothetical protein